MTLLLLNNPRKVCLPFKDFARTKRHSAIRYSRVYA